MLQSANPPVVAQHIGADDWIEETIRTVPLHRLLSEKRHAFPNHYAAGEGGVKITYQDLDRAVDKLAAKLLEAGVKPGDRVSLMGPPGIEFLVTYLATISIGGVWLGLNSRYTTPELEHIIQDGEPKIIFEASSLNDEQRYSLRSAAACGTQEFSDFLGLTVADLPGHSAPGHHPELEALRESLPVSLPAALFYTSGTTGKPKGALANAAALARLAVHQSEVWATGHPRTIANLPINHTGCVGDLVSVFQYSAGYLRFIHGFDIEETVNAIAEDGINALFQIPMQLIGLSTHPRFAEIARKQLTMVGWGGAALPIKLVEFFTSFIPQIVIGYGSSETVASLTITPEDATIEQLAHTVGIPDPAFDMHLLIDDGRALPVTEARGLTGEVLVKHWTFLPEYLHNPQATAEIYTEDGYLKMDDIGYVREDGYLSLVGRTKEMFKSGGYNVYPKEVEIALEQHPLVRLAAVVRRPDPTYSEVGVAFLEIDGDHRFNNHIDELTAELKSHSKTLLANYKVPKNFVFVEELPKLATGKIDKVSLGVEAKTLTPERTVY